MALRTPAEMTDRELEDELARRRAARGNAHVPIRDEERARLREFERAQKDPPSNTSLNSNEMSQAVRRTNLARHYAALELEPSANSAQVEEAYRRLSQRYDPERHSTDPDKYRTAQHLVTELTRAYRAIMDALRR